MTDRPSYIQLNQTIERFGQFRKRWAILEGWSRFALLGPGTLTVWFLLDWAFELPAWPLFVSFLLCVALGAWSAAWYALRAHLRRIRTEQEALLIESLHSRMDNQLIGSLQLGREVAEVERAGRPLGYSQAYVAALIDLTAGNLERSQPLKLVDLTRAKRLVVAGGATAIAILLILAFAPDAVARRAERLKDSYAAVLDTLFPVEMHVRPGDLAVVRGRPIALEVEVRGARRRRVLLIRTDLESRKEERTSLELEGEKASFRLEEARDSFGYRFEYAARKTPEHKILVGDLPQVSAINYELAYPAYTGQPPRTLTGRVPKLHGLVGTGVLVSFAATTDLHPEYSFVEWQDGSKQSLSITGRYGHFSFTIGRPERATIQLTGAYGRGFEMERPIALEIVVQKDEPPVVQALLKTRKLTLLVEEAASFGFHFLAEDDFGVSEVNLDYRIDTIDELLGRPARDGAVQRRIEPPRDRVKGSFTEIFKGLSPTLEPGDRVKLTVSAKDNNTETGPSLGRSLPIEIVVVRPDLAGFIEHQFGFEAHSLLGGLKKVQRATNLLIEPPKTVRTQPKVEFEKHMLKARVGQESWPSGSEDLIGDYFRLLSGEK